MFHLFNIDSSNAGKLSPLLYPHEIEKLQKTNSQETAFSIGASIFSKPVGVINAVSDPTTDIPIIEKLFVIEKYRNSGIGTALLRAMEKRLAEKGFQKAGLVFFKPEKPPEFPLDFIAAKQGWSKPVLKTLFVKADERIRNAPWYNKFKLSPSYELFLWCRLSEEEKQDFKKSLEKDPCYPGYLSPFINEEKIEPVNSVGLKYKDELVGWIITERIDEDTILYSRGFIKSQLQKSGLYVILISQAVEYSYQNGIYNGIYYVDAKDSRMFNFVNRRMKDFVVSLKGKYFSYKHLDNK